MELQKTYSCKEKLEDASATSNWDSKRREETDARTSIAIAISSSKATEKGWRWSCVVVVGLVGDRSPAFCPALKTHRKRVTSLP